jgi:hypothetical protein
LAVDDQDVLDCNGPECSTKNIKAPDPKQDVRRNE